MSEVLLSVQGLAVAYGGIQAVKGVDFEVRAGEKVCLIGANGAGKTTVLKAITGLLPMQAGQVSVMGQSTQGQGPWDLVQRGLVMVPEGRGVFPRLTVAENLDMGAYLKSSDAANKERIYSIFPQLKPRKGQRAGSLSGGERQMLAMGRALMGAPKLLMLDEPSLGLAPLIVADVMRTVSRLRDEGVAILLVEQNARAALQIADYGYVLDGGTVVLEGDSRTLQGDARVVETYLGVLAADTDPPGRAASGR